MLGRTLLENFFLAEYLFKSQMRDSGTPLKGNMKKTKNPFPADKYEHIAWELGYDSEPSDLVNPFEDGLDDFRKAYIYGRWARGNNEMDAHEEELLAKFK